MKEKTFLTAVLLLALLTSSACGSGNNKPLLPPLPTPAPVSEVTPTPTPEPTPDPTPKPAPEPVQIEIGLDNYTEYFEFHTEERWKTNAFGETSQLQLIEFFRLKPEYMGRLMLTKTDLAVEYDCHAGQVPITVDFENKTYDIRYDEIYNPDWIPHKDITEKMGFPYTEEPQRIFGVSTCFGINESYQESICVPIEETVIVRIEGTLWLTGRST